MSLLTLSRTKTFQGLKAGAVGPAQVSGQSGVPDGKTPGGGKGAWRVAGGEWQGDS